MDFYKILERSTVRGRGDNKEVVSIDIYPDFIVGRSKDLMIRGKSVYAVWDEEKGLWSQDEYDVQRIVDQDMYNYREKIQSSVKLGNIPINVLSMKSNKSKVWKDFKQYVSTLADNYHQLDEDLTFLNTEVIRRSRRMITSAEGSPTLLNQETIRHGTPSYLRYMTKKKEKRLNGRSVRLYPVTVRKFRNFVCSMANQAPAKAPSSLLYKNSSMDTIQPSMPNHLDHLLINLRLRPSVQIRLLQSNMMEILVELKITPELIR